MTTFTSADRKKLAAEGVAMPDGSYPIRNQNDLQNAIHAVGRGNGSHDAIRKHIMKRAKALGLTNMCPADWSSDGNMQQSDFDMNDFLEHHGIKGMHWGVRKARPTHPGSVDYRTAKKIQAKAREHGVHSLTNKELQTLANRRQAEQRHRQLQDESNFARTHNAVKAGLAVAGTVTAVYTVATSPAAKAGATAVKKFMASGAARKAVTSVAKFATRV